MRTGAAILLCLALVAAPWPAWAAVAGVATPKPAAAAQHTPSLAGAPTAAFATEASIRGKTVVMVGTARSRPFIIEEAVRVSRELGLTLVLVDDPENRGNSKDLVPDENFIAAPINSRDDAALDLIANIVAAHPVAGKADVVASFMSLYAPLTGKLRDKLGAAGIPGDVVAAADDKPQARARLNVDPAQAVAFSELFSVAQTRAAYRDVSDNGRHKVVIKTSRGENSRFLALGLTSEDDAAAAYARLDAEVKEFTTRPEARLTTFNTHPGLMMERMIEKLPNTVEMSAEIVMQRGKPAFGILSDTLGIGPDGKLASGILVFPSQLEAASHAAILSAAGAALNTLGITDGNARLDLMMTKDGPRIIEINPMMGSVSIFKAVQALTGMSLVEQGLRALLGLEVNPGRAPDGVAHYIFTASRHTGQLETVEGVLEARSMSGIVEARPFLKPGDTVIAAKGSSYEEWGEVIGKGRTWSEAIAAALAGAKRIVLKVRKQDGTVVSQTGEHLQPTADELVGPAATAPAAAPVKEESVSLFSKVVMGFLSTFLLVSTVVESTSLAVSQMTQPLSQGFMALAMLTSVSYAAYSLGAHLGGKWVDRFGEALSYRVVLATRSVLWTGIAALFYKYGLDLPLAALVTLFSLDYFVHSIGRLAEHKLQVTWFKDKPALSSRFGSARDFIEYGTVFIAAIMALAISAVGFGAVLYPAPFAFAAAALIALFLPLPGATKSAASAVAATAVNAWKVVANPRVLKPLAGYVLVNSFLYLVYYIVATAFGAYASATPEAAAAVAGSLTGVYGIGALLGALATDRLSGKIDKEAGGDAEKARVLYAKSAARSLIWTAAALLGSWFFVSNTLLATFAWPIFAVTPALLVIGFTAQMSSIHLDTIIKDRIPKQYEKDAGRILGAVRTITYVQHSISFLIWGSLFALFGAQTFIGFAAFYTLVAGLYLWLARDLKRNP